MSFPQNAIKMIYAETTWFMNSVVWVKTNYVSENTLGTVSSDSSPRRFLWRIFESWCPIRKDQYQHQSFSVLSWWQIMLLGQKVVASKGKSTCQLASVFSGILTESAFFQLIFEDLLILLFGLICDTRYRIGIQLCVSLTKVVDVLNRLSFRQPSASRIPRDTQTARQLGNLKWKLLQIKAWQRTSNIRSVFCFF